MKNKQNAIKQATVSLLISTYNWPEALECCFTSILSQNVLPEEIVIADDGSKEETKNKIESFRKSTNIHIIHIWHEDKGFRLAQIRNLAIDACSKDYVIQIDGDIIMDSNFIKDHLALAQKNHFLCGSRVWMNKKQSDNLLSDPKHIQINKLKLPFSSILNSFRSSFLSGFLADRYKKNRPTALRGCNMSFWREDLLAVNGYDQNIKGWGSEDAELALRLINKGIKKRFLKFSAVAYHLHHKENSKSNLPSNEKILAKTLEQKRTWANNGIINENL